ncbi:MAG: ABC transporter ATP-binding protein [Lewinellaceae bacterium]|nr:ABC transporter ATP-binding protein [Saprospiraceae bacterium]MCB9312558.1 ABC transporter ATP-binding protein [Lewinellaceae bacterium]
MIQLHQLSKSFGRLEVLRGIDLAFDQPGITAVLGPNGSGKSTLLKSILGMVIPDAGQILFHGKPIDPLGSYRKDISYLPQIARFPENLRVAELIRMIESFRPQESSSAALIRDFGLGPVLQSQLGHLSGGTRQKVNLVLTLMYDTPVIILDEPTAGLDPVALVRLKDRIIQAREAGKILLVTTHIMSLVEELADRVVFLLEGRIYFDGKPGELKQRVAEPTLEKAIANLLSGGHLSPIQLPESAGRVTRKMNGHVVHPQYNP